MKGLLCSNLFTTDIERTLSGKTQAVKELVMAARARGLPLDAVVRVSPLISKRGLGWIGKSMYKGMRVYDIPLLGFHFLYNEALTSFLVKNVVDNDYKFAVCHYGRNVLFIKKHLPEIKKIIYIVHNTDFHIRNKAVTTEALEAATAVFARSDALMSRLYNDFGFACDGVIFSGVSNELFVEDTAENEYSSGELKLIMACSFIPIKNVESVIRAVGIVKSSGYPVSLKIFGDGPLRRQIEKTIKELGLESSVHLKGFAPRSEVLAEMRKSNVFIMPSAPETFGLAFLESMASGCVVIGHAGWGIDGVVEDGVNGYLVENAAPTNIANKLFHYLSGDTRSMHLGSLSKAKMYTKDKAIENYINSIRTAVSEK